MMTLSCFQLSRLIQWSQEEMIYTGCKTQLTKYHTAQNAHLNKYSNLAMHFEESQFLKSSFYNTTEVIRLILF